jgi:hypothetical protein
MARMLLDRQGGSKELSMAMYGLVTVNSNSPSATLAASSQSARRLSEPVPEAFVIAVGTRMDKSNR